MKLLLLVLGWLFVALGVIGIFIPLMPTVVFLLLALACFSRSSQKMHDWLIYHPVLGTPLRNWQESRTIPKKAKFFAITSIVFSGAISLYFIPLLPVKIGLVVFLAILIVFLLRIPNSQAIPIENHLDRAN